MIKKNNTDTFAASGISCEDASKKVIDVRSLTDLLQRKDKTKDHCIAINISSTDPEQPDQLIKSYVELSCVCCINILAL